MMNVKGCLKIQQGIIREFEENFERIGSEAGIILVMYVYHTYSSFCNSVIFIS